MAGITEPKNHAPHPLRPFGRFTTPTGCPAGTTSTPKSQQVGHTRVVFANLGLIQMIVKRWS